MIAFQRGHSRRADTNACAKGEGTPAILEPEEKVALSDFDVIWLRQDPPFDMHYITTTHLLDLVHPKTLVVNDPFWVRNYPEKLLVLNFPDLTPPTTIARDLETIKAFKAKHKDIILKPLYGNGGAGVFRLDEGDRNLSSLQELFTGFSREPLIVQKFLPDVSNGDKRVILVNGEPVGAINRVPAKGETRSNMHVGGRPEKVGLTDRDREICAKIGLLLREKADFCRHRRDRNYLTEINVTSRQVFRNLNGLTVSMSRKKSGRRSKRNGPKFLARTRDKVDRFGKM